MANCKQQEIHLDDVGTSFEITLYDCDGIVDLTGALSLLYKFTDPNGVTTQKTASFLTDGTDGKLVYNTIAGDLDSVGTWKLQAYVQLATGSWNSNIETFKVYDNLA